jgi:hypothetical protein
MSRQDALALRAFVLLWLVLGVVFLAGRVALMVATSTLDLRYPVFFELAVLPPLQGAALIWVGGRLRPGAWRTVGSAILEQRGPRRALIAGALAAAAFAVLRWSGAPPRSIDRDSALAFGAFTLIAAVTAGVRAVRATAAPARADWALAALVAALVGSNSVAGWLETLAIAALPSGVGAAVARAALAVAGVAVATALTLRLEKRIPAHAAVLLWAALSLLLAATSIRFLLWLLGFPAEPWTAVARTLSMLGAASILATVLAGPPPPAAAHAARAAPAVGWVRAWLVLALIHVAVSATMTLALFPGWWLGWVTLTSWLGITAVQAAAVAALSALERRVVE